MLLDLERKKGPIFAFGNVCVKKPQWIFGGGETNIYQKEQMKSLFMSIIPAKQQ